MNRAFGRLALAAAMIVLVGAATASAQRGGQAGQQSNRQNQQQVAQQQTTQQQMTRQQQMARIDRTMLRLQQLERHANRLSLDMNQRAQSGGGQFGARERSMQQLCDSVTGLAGDMTRTMERVREQLRDPELSQDREMRREMEQLRVQITEMAGPLDEALQTMSRMHERLGPPQAGG